MDGLIGLDWGTSTLRAYRIDATGHLEETRSRPWGIRRLPDGGFDAALIGITEDWPDTLPRLASGMVGSRDGWREVPYVDLPVGTDSIARRLGRVRTARGSELLLVPGLRDPCAPDVMRGEETQLIGALALRPDLAANSVWILPGTHSKWASVRAGNIVGFRTYLTGELFALLRAHSILAAGQATSRPNLGAFERGVAVARDSGAAGAFSRLFSARVLMLDGSLQPDAVSEYLSGLLIGEEFRAALAASLLGSDLTPLLAGEPALCERYRRAGGLFGLDLSAPLQDAAARGLWELAVLAGVTHATSESARTC